ncbi:hypothetical protein GGF46_001175 [Coemansia sp. RSA 552]|nr:hypothetical protein GGF46_001175 [Coemansia sp. RSA 552]
MDVTSLLNPRSSSPQPQLHRTMGQGNVRFGAGPTHSTFAYPSPLENQAGSRRHANAVSQHGIRAQHPVSGSMDGFGAWWQGKNAADCGPTAAAASTAGAWNSGPWGSNLTLPPIADAVGSNVLSTNSKQAKTAGAYEMSFPQIVVPTQPMFAHSATSRDRSGEYINSSQSDTTFDIPEHALTMPPPLPSHVSSGMFRIAANVSLPRFSPACSSSSFARNVSPGGLAQPSAPFASHHVSLATPPAKVIRMGRGMPVPVADYAYYDDDDTASELSDTPEDCMPDPLPATMPADGRNNQASSSSAAAAAAPSPTLSSRPLCLSALVPEPQFPVPAPVAVVAKPSTPKKRKARAGSKQRKSTGASLAGAAKSPETAAKEAAQSVQPRRGSAALTGSTSSSGKTGKAAETASTSASGKAGNPAEAAGTLADSQGEKPLVDWRSLDLPEAIFIEAQELYERVKTMKAVQNRQPIRMKHAILAALTVFLCRNKNYPRTFTQICAAANVTKREICMYYNLMKKVLGSEYTSIQRAQPADFLHRWCTVLELPKWVAESAARVHDRAEKMAITQGKCPISVSAASMWMVIWTYNHRHSLWEIMFQLPEGTPVTSSAVPNLPSLVLSEHTLPCDQRDVCKTSTVVIATLTSVCKQLVPHLNTLVGDLMSEHLEKA